MKKILLVIISGACACCLVSCKDSGGKTSLLVVPAAASAVEKTTWVQDAYLKASNATTDTGYASSVAISGDTIAVGAQSVSSTQATITNTDGAADTSTDLPAAVSAGAVYVYKKDSTGNWIQDAYLRPSNANALEMFGCSVAVSGDIIVAGAHWDYTNQSIVTNDDGHPTVAESSFAPSPSGAAYVFKKDASGNWIQDAYLKASNAGSSDNFGNSVAVDGESIVVGAYNEGSDSTIVTNNINGHPTVAESNEDAIAAGAAYVFKKDVNGSWYQDAYLKATNAGASDYFGCSVSISGNIIAVGAYQEDSNATGITNLDSSHADPGTVNNSGAVYVFKRNAMTGNWSQDAYFKASNAGADDNFGIAAALNGDTIVVAATAEDSWSTIINANGYAESNNGLTDAGAAYVFKRDATTGDWSQDAYLKASNAGASDGFGCSVAVSGDTIAVGSNSEDSGQSTITNADGLAADDDTMSYSGAVYVFKKDTSGNWVQDAYLKASNNPVIMGLGAEVAISGSTIVAGAGSERNATPGIVNKNAHPTTAECSFGTLNVGAAYVFKVK